jgi:GntR family transcriptional regulator, N-acetylglucosamine utilization regulator
MHAIDKSHSAPLKRGSGIPLYHQIQQRLLDQIQSGELKPGTPMPSIERIARRMGVSPMTVRQAMRALSDHGVIYSRQGKGTFISGIKLERDFRQVLSFTEETVAHGAKPSSKVLSFETNEPNQKVRDALALNKRDKVYALRLVRYGDSIPMAIECSYLPAQLFPGLMEKFDPAASLYEELSVDYGVQLAVTDEVIEVGKANGPEARLLEIASQSPVFLFTRTSYLEDGTPAEYVNSVYRGDRYKVVNRLMRMRRNMV